MSAQRSRLSAIVAGASRHRRVALGGGLVVVFVLIALLAGVAAPYDPIKQDLSQTLKGPSLEHLLGTDELGRDMLTRIMYGARWSLIIGVSSVAIAAAGGIVLGLVSGSFGGTTDLITMRVLDVVMTFPSVLFALLLAALLGSGVGNLIISVGVLSIPSYARLVRSVVLSIRQIEFVEAARAVGCSSGRIILFHLFPNCLSPIIVHSTYLMAFAILLAASLSFLGVGVPAPTPEWGSMMATGRNYMNLAQQLILIPGSALMVLILAMNILGDGLRDLLDPRLRV
ncbi:MAG: ABC transporter permease [Chloroflexi bacterium]|nr:ABC transporter permease [Chloroflexota bacterium]